MAINYRLTVYIRLVRQSSLISHRLKCIGCTGVISFHSLGAWAVESSSLYHTCAHGLTFVCARTPSPTAITLEYRVNSI